MFEKREVQIMSKNHRILVADKNIGKMTGRIELTICNLCRQLFKAGDQIFSHRGGHHIKRYHIRCAKKVNLI